MPAASRTEANGVITIVVPAKPIGKPRWQKSDKWRPRACIVDYRAWTDYVRLITHPVPPATSVMALSWTAYFEVSTSWAKAKQAAMIDKQHRQMPDRDNIDKAVLDALWPRSRKIATGGEGDDSAIAVGSIGKYWARESYLEIRIRLEKLP